MIHCIKIIRKYLVLILIGFTYIFSVKASTTIDNINKFIYEQGEKHGVDKKAIEELKRSNEELRQSEERLLKRYHEIEVYKQALVISSSRPSRDITEEVIKQAMRELKVSRVQARRLVQDKDPRIKRIGQKINEAEVNKIKKQAEVEVKDKEFENMAICLHMHQLLNDKPQSKRKLALKEEMIKQLNLSSEEIESLIKTNDPKYAKIWQEIIDHEIKEAYRRAKIIIFSKQLAK